MQENISFLALDTPAFYLLERGTSWAMEAHAGLSPLPFKNGGTNELRDHVRLRCC